MKEIQSQINQSKDNKHSNSKKRESYIIFKCKLLKGYLTERRKNQ